MPKVLREKSLFQCAYAMETIGFSPRLTPEECSECCWAVTKALIMTGQIVTASLHGRCLITVAQLRLCCLHPDIRHSPLAETQIHRTVWVGRGQGSLSPALQWMAHPGVEHVALVLFVPFGPPEPISESPGSYIVADSFLLLSSLCFLQVAFSELLQEIAGVWQE